MYLEVIDGIITRVRCKSDYSDQVVEVEGDPSIYICGDSIDYYDTKLGIRRSNTSLVSLGLMKLQETQKVDENDNIVNKTDIEMYIDGTKELDQKFTIDPATNEVREKTNAELYADGLLELEAGRYWDEETQSVRELSPEELYTEGLLSETDYTSYRVETINVERTAKIAEVTWMRDRHKDEEQLNLSQTLTDQEYITLLEYIQKLRDITLQESYPQSVVWPELGF